ncbi:hemerythrin domain-containing protein [Streptomyces sp. NPDC050263]|uniref:hemerythrin domain-containing protein n=1 Tax=Streptomyces sp. NPDC050263 TaxID=3155037 RepID=UPI00344ABDF0
MDVRDMLVVHEAFRDAFDRMPDLVRGVPAGDIARAKVVADHIELIQDFLHLHHKGEDDLLWPKLLERAPADLHPTLQLMDDQHVRIDALITEGAKALEAWRREAGTADGEHLADLLVDLGAALTEHLGIEEKEVLSVVGRYLTVPEWHQIGDHAINGLPKSRLPIIFGMLAYFASPEVVKLLLSPAPLVPRLLMPLLGPRAYASHARRVYGSAAKRA